MNPEEESKHIESYLLGNLSKEEVALVEKRMSEDIRFRESVLLHKQLFESLSENNWSSAKNVDIKRLQEYEQLYRDKETLQLKETLKNANRTYQKQHSKSNKSILFYLSAALIAVTITIGTLLPEQLTPQELYVEYYTVSDIPSLVSRGGEEDTSLIDAERYFEEGDYEKALAILIPKVTVTIKNKASVLLYKGISEMELEQYEKAAATFDQLIESDLMDAPMGLWYKALLYLKTGDTEKAKELLLQINASSSNYKYTEAKAVLEEL
ncbi:MAG: tetratricopeptide (TPR) repeat protein [Dokdonia sp.]|jgi:tetratricopeptide (TPR) repeat protein